MILTSIAQLFCMTGSNVGKVPSIPPIPDKQNLVEIISKINSLNNTTPAAKSPASEVVDLNASQEQQEQRQDSVEKTTNVIDKQTVPSTMDLLGVFSTGLATSTPETNTSQSQGSSDSSGNNKSKSHSTEPAIVVNSHDKPTRDFPAAGFMRSNSTYESRPHIYKQTEQETRPYLSLQLFGSTEEDIPPKIDSLNKYLSSESSNPLDERSPSSSPPITRKFFPIHSVDEEVRHPHITDYGEDATMGEVSTSQAWCAPPLDLFKDSERPIENGSPPNPGYQSCYASTSCSDHSPSTSNSDGQVVSTRSLQLHFFTTFPRPLTILIMYLYYLDLPFYRTGLVGLFSSCLARNLVQYLGTFVTMYDHLLILSRHIAACFTLFFMTVI